jgi:hypothetical protein
MGNSFLDDSVVLKFLHWRGMVKDNKYVYFKLKLNGRNKINTAHWVLTVDAGRNSHRRFFHDTNIFVWKS